MEEEIKLDKKRILIVVVFIVVIVSLYGMKIYTENKTADKLFNDISAGLEGCNVYCQQVDVKYTGVFTSFGEDGAANCECLVIPNDGENKESLQGEDTGDVL